MQRWAPRVDHIDPGPRHVAVMFAEVDGLAGLIESIGAEMAVSRVAPVMEQLVALVLAHAGLVQHIVGGGSMSVFGLNAKAGDEAAHAVRAGVALVSAAADRRLLPVHVGIECGEVVVSRSWEPAGFAVWGDTVTAAKELCDTAGPGTVLLGPRALSLAGHVVGDVPTAGASTAHATGNARAERGRPGPGRHGQIGVERWPATNALTRAEAAVARLVAEGLSNPQIANRLYISRHTAETHMKHIFAKLGVSSRAELAARVASRLVAGVAWKIPGARG
jgi:class 3 adenylate cyclase/DNA-binding CsgD family transcriptional regulator